MPVTIYQSADDAARHDKLKQLLFMWQVQVPDPVSGMNDVVNYEAKIAALTPYLDNEHVRTSVMRMREEICKYIHGS